MFSGLFASAKKTTKTIAILDIGSGSVGAALARLRTDGNPELFFTTREALPFRLTRSGREMTVDVLAAAKRAFEVLRKEAALHNEGSKISPIKIEHVAVFFAAPWSTTTVRTLRFSRTKPFTVTADLLKRMLADEARSATAKNLGHEDASVVERVATSLRLNGYPVDEISDAQVLSAEITLATTIVPQSLIEKVDDAIGDLPGTPPRTCHSFILPASLSLISHFPAVKDALIIDVGAEVTECMIIRDGAPFARASTPIGSHVLLRTLRSHAKMGKAQASSATKLAALEGTRLSSEAKSSLDAACAKWGEDIADALRSLSGVATPKEVFLFAEDFALSWFTDALRTLRAVGQKSGSFSVHPVLGKDFTPLIKGNNGLAPDPFLACEVLFADARFDENHGFSLASPREPVLARVHDILSTSTPANVA